MGFLNIVRAVSWMKLIQRKKNWISSISLILLPTLLFGVLVFIHYEAGAVSGTIKEGPEKVFEHEPLLHLDFIDDSPIPLFLYTPENDLTRNIIDRVNLAANFDSSTDISKGYIF